MWNNTIMRMFDEVAKSLCCNEANKIDNLGLKYELYELNKNLIE